MHGRLLLLTISCLFSGKTLSSIHFDGIPNEYRELPRFWSNSGFSPPAPLPLNNSNVTHELLSHDVYLNMEYLAALPNSGIKYIRIHWLLSLIKFQYFDRHNIPAYDFSEMDRFLDHLFAIHLYPVIEFMGNLFPRNTRLDNGFLWKDFAYQLVSRYLARYGRPTLLKWRFELWNEPDLKNYNILNFTLNDYLDYANGVSNGLKAAVHRSYPEMKLQLRGPAGLFKAFEKHHLCWGLLNHCNLNTSICPIDLITFHRKGVASAEDILKNSTNLIRTIERIYPNLMGFSYANTEADPSSGWSKQVPAYADVHYANTLTSIVFQHWNALYTGQLNRLESISHDNAFLSYHPHEFEQRTMLARFRINDTQPPTVQFIQKPVYAALGLLGSLAMRALPVITTKNITYLMSMSGKYVAVLLISNNFNDTRMNNLQPVRFQLNITDWTTSLKELNYAYFVESLQPNRTDPFAVWQRFGRPSYPNETVVTEMLRAQGPHVLKNPQVDNHPHFIEFNAILSHPWIVLIRICSTLVAKPTKVKNVRIHGIDQSKLLILWNDWNNPSYERCIRSYEIFYAPSTDPVNERHNIRTERLPMKRQWKQITQNKHVPFLSFCHQLSDEYTRLKGFYKVRAVDIFGRFGAFSKVHEF